jgi:hypothetical protein
MNMKLSKPESPLEDLLTQIGKWKLEAASPYNDGWTREYYQRMLDEVKRRLNKALADIEAEETLDNYD